MTDKKVAVVGAGWAGAVTARELFDAGFHVEVFERSVNVGGHARVESLNGVIYEPNGAHIFHTSNRRVAEYVQRFGMKRRYQHRVVTEVFLSEEEERSYMLSWPPQVSELRQLPLWPKIEAELSDLPPNPTGDDFESFVVSMMGKTLYELFIRDYTIKQWGCPPSKLSSRFAPKRVELRDDGNLRLFRDPWEFFEQFGPNSIIESILAPVPVTCGARISVIEAHELAKSFDALVITAPLDDFLNQSEALEWRGIVMRSRYFPTENESDTVTPAYVVNRPSPRVGFTRTVETKHATGQLIRGTVISEEYPGADARHYPVHTVDGKNEARNTELKRTIASELDIRVFFCGRLANYLYINQDQAIDQALMTAQEVVKDVSG